VGARTGEFSLYEERYLRDAVLADRIFGTLGSVIGSEFQLIEAIAFRQHPIKVTTIECGRINSTVQWHQAFTPQEFSAAFLDQEILFDWVTSVSSLEHSGLGRYGDRLNPEGDIDAAGECFCMLKPGGYLFICSA
jgi:hypothetical protein